MLKKITIENFKSLKHLEYDCAGLNLLTGVNGAGKSSFIQFLLMLKSLPEMIDQLADETNIGGWNTGACEYGDIHYRYSDELVRFRVGYKWSDAGEWDETICRCLGARTGESVNVVVADDPGFERYIKEIGRAGNDVARIIDGIVGNAASPGEHLENMYVASAQSNMLLPNGGESPVSQDDMCRNMNFQNVIRRIRYISAFRGAPSDVQDGARLMAGGFPNGQIDPEGRDVFAFLNAMGNRPAFSLKGETRNFLSDTSCDKVVEAGAQKGICYKTLNEQVAMWLSTISPGAKLRLRGVRVGDKHLIETKVAYGVSADVEREFRPQNVGFGISYAIPVIVALLTSGKRDIVIIENPEAHLHPRGQAEMGNLIAHTVAAGAQVFVETHSDHVINGVRVAVKKGIVKPEDVNIAFFERGPHDVPQADGTTRREIYSEVTNIKVDANGSLSEWPKDFMDEWGIQQMKLLRS